jgi:hypothetical protein
VVARTVGDQQALAPVQFEQGTREIGQFQAELFDQPGRDQRNAVRQPQQAGKDLLCR